MYTTDECESGKRLCLEEAWKNGVRKFKNVLLSFESRRKIWQTISRSEKKNDNFA